MMECETEAVDRLRNYLNHTDEGDIDSEELGSLLATAWADIGGTESESTAPYKLLGRVEASLWTPPILEFEIERHGQTAMGSTRATVHHWIVDLDRLVAEITGERYRRKTPAQPRLDVRPLVAMVAGSILSGEAAPYLQWPQAGGVRVKVGELIPGIGFKQTVAGRRKRFRKHLEETLLASGWSARRPNVFRPPESTLAALSAGVVSHHYSGNRPHTTTRLTDRHQATVLHLERRVAEAAQGTALNVARD